MSKRLFWAKALTGTSAACLAVSLLPISALAASNQSAWDTKGRYVYEFLASQGVQPDRTGVSPFTDVPSNSWLWGWVHKGLELGIVSADTMHRFGAYDKIYQGPAAQIAVSFWHMNLGSGVSPQKWADSDGLVQGIQHANLNVADAKLLLTHIQSLVSALKPFQSSWSLTPAEAIVLQHAFVNEQSAPNVKMNGKMSIRLKLKLTTAGQADAATEKSVQQLQQPRIITLSSQTGEVNGQKVAVITISIPSTSASTPALTLEEYLQGTTLYTNQGAGWQLSPLSATLSSVLSTTSSTLPTVSLGEFMDVSALPSADGYHYSAQINTTALVTLLKPLLGSLPVSSMNGISSSEMQSFIGTILHDTKATVQIDISTANGKDLLSSENMQLAMVIPTATLAPLIASAEAAITSTSTGNTTSTSTTTSSSTTSASLTTASNSAQLLKELSSFEVDEDLAASYSYNNTSITVPAGLPTATSTTPASGTSTGTGQ